MKLQCTFKFEDRLRELTSPGEISGPARWGIFETMRVEKGSIRHLNLHLKRMQTGLDWMKLQLSARKIISIAFDEFKNRTPSYLLTKVWKMRLSVIRDHSKDIFVLLHAEEVAPCLERVRLYFNQHTCVRPSEHPENYVKTISRGILEKLFWIANQSGFSDALIVNERGEVCETTRSNIFFVMPSGKVVTPHLSSGLLPGTRRLKAIQVLKKTGIDVREKPVTLDEVRSARGCFLTGSIIKAVEVSEIQNITRFNTSSEVINLLRKYL